MMHGRAYLCFGALQRRAGPEWRVRNHMQEVLNREALCKSYVHRALTFGSFDLLESNQAVPQFCPMTNQAEE